MRRTVGVDGLPVAKELGENEVAVKRKPLRRNVVEEQPKTEAEVAEEFMKPVESFDLDLDSDELLGKKNRRADTDKRNNEKKPKKKRSKKRKIITGVVVVLLVGAVAFYFWGEWLIKKLTGGNSGLWDAITTLVSDETTPLKKDANGRTNILAIGTSGYEMSGSGHDGAQLTDSIMVISLDEETKDVAMVSLPRDLKVGYTCTATGKVNEVYWCANQDGTNEAAGVEAIKNEVQEITGLELQYWVHVDWGALVQVVDAIGGITVTLDEDIADYMTETFITAGEAVTLNGEQALGLARARHGTANGDFTRGASQQKILMAIKDKVVAGGLDLGATVNLVNVLGDNLRMNLTIDEIKTLMKFLQDLPAENMRTIELLETANGSYMTTATIGGISYVIPTAGAGNYEELQKYIAQMVSKDPVVREGANIVVLNGSGVAGMAREEKNKLEEQGLAVSWVDDAPAGEWGATYYIYDVSGKKPGTKAKLEEVYGVSAVAGEVPGYNAGEADLVVVVGSGATGQS